MNFSSLWLYLCQKLIIIMSYSTILNFNCELGIQKEIPLILNCRLIIYDEFDPKTILVDPSWKWYQYFCSKMFYNSMMIWNMWMKLSNVKIHWNRQQIQTYFHLTAKFGKEIGFRKIRSSARIGHLLILMPLTSSWI